MKEILRKCRAKVDTIISNKQSSIARQVIATIKSGDYFVEPAPPYYAQFASPKLISDILNKKIKASDDSKWQLFGFKTKKEYEFWSWRLCGLICVKMVLDAYGAAPDENVSSLTKQGVRLGGYQVATDTGWFSAPLVKSARQFGLDGQVYRVLSPKVVAKNMLENKFVIASVNPRVIRKDIEIAPNEDKNGHLVLVWGVKIENGKVVGFYINNPSGRTKSTQQKAFIPIDHWYNAFGQRGFSLFQK